MPKATRPHRSVATIEYSPIVDIAIVTGSSTSAKCVGATTSSSSVPCHRSRCIAAPADVLVADQMPITAAPNEA